MNQKKQYLRSAYSFAVFLLWTIAVRYIDVQAIGPNGSSVGLGAINGSFHKLTGVHMELYVITDWLSLVPAGFIVGFALLGLIQWIRRKRLLSVDRSILALGGFYVIVLAMYAFFETVIINHRPVLINGILEASYPSSTTMLVLCVMTTGMLQLRNRIRVSVGKTALSLLITVYMTAMVIGRLISGVHWLSDIVGGILLSFSLIMLYCAISAE